MAAEKTNASLYVGSVRPPSPSAIIGKFARGKMGISKYFNLEIMVHFQNINFNLGMVEISPRPNSELTLKMSFTSYGSLITTGTKSGLNLAGPSKVFSMWHGQR